jgi:hypothetical protein
MRTYLWWVAAGLALGLANAADAQVISYGGAVPRPQFIFPFPGVQRTLFSLRDPNLPIAQPMTVNTGGSSLTRFFPNLGLRNGPPIIGQSVYPTPSQMPGLDYFRAFQLRRPGPIGP